MWTRVSQPSPFVSVRLLVCLWCFSCCGVSSLLCGPGSGVGSPISSFTSSSVSNCGILWRYWVEDASASTDSLRIDLQAMSDVGSSGVELLAYENYGFPVPNDIGTVGYGSTAYKQLVETTANIANTLNLTLDVTAGPSQGAGIPTQNPDVPGYSTELVYGYTVIPPNQSFNGALPTPNIFPMVKYGGSVAPTFNITSYRLQAIFVASVLPSTHIVNTSYPTTVLLDINSIQNIVSNVTGNTVSISPATTESVILAFYSRRTGYQEAYPSYSGPNPNLPASWGAYVVDHFSAQGAQTIDNFTQSYLFNPATPSLSTSSGLIWEDSMEFRAQLFWTESFLSRFESLRGYNAITVGALPSFYSRTLAPFGGDNLPTQLFAYANDTLNQQFAFDYFDTLSALYREYISTRNTNARKIGRTLSLQPGYGMSLDVAAAAGVVDLPEIESLAFTTVDKCRQASGGAHLGGANILSTELGAVQLKAYSQQMSEIIQLAHIQFAGSVNRLVIHGFPNTDGHIPLTTWPGLTTFSYVYSEMHGPRQPGWPSYRGYMDYFARTQYILRKGSTGKIDIAIYRHAFDVTGSRVFDSNVLQVLGYTYEYLSPYNLDLPLATVKNNRLSDFQLGPGYKALILDHQTTIISKAAQKILTFAQQGLPVIIIGNAPNNIPGYAINPTQKDQVVAAMAQLVALPNVKQVAGYTDVPSALTALGIRPAAALIGGTSTENVYSIRRSDITNSIGSDYYWLYNSGSTVVNVTISFETCGTSAVPFILDSWTGTIRALSWSGSASSDISASRTNNVVVQLNGIYLQPQQTIVMAFTNGTTFEGQNINTVPTKPLTPFININTVSYSTIQLGNWNLNVTSFQAPSDLTVYQSTKVPIGPIALGNSFTAWNQLPAFINKSTSGIGVYSTSFRIDVDPNTILAVLDVSTATGVTSHTVTVSLNGRVIASAIDPSIGRVELPSSILIAGQNSLTISIATTLLNALNTVPATQILALGGNRLSGLPFTPPDTINGIQAGTINIRILNITTNTQPTQGSSSSTATNTNPGSSSSSTGGQSTPTPSNAGPTPTGGPSSVGTLEGHVHMMSIVGVLTTCLYALF